jgi:hypothetical protein
MSTILLPHEVSPSFKESYLRDIRPSINQGLSLVPMRTIYESYTPENTHLMREYMLYVIIRNVRRMRKHKLITDAVFWKFNLLETLKSPEHQSKELTTFLSKHKKNNRL